MAEQRSSPELAVAPRSTGFRSVLVCLDTVAELRREVDDVVCLHEPEALYAIGLWYADFRQVLRILERAAQEHPATAP